MDAQSVLLWVSGGAAIVVVVLLVAALRDELKRSATALERLLPPHVFKDPPVGPRVDIEKDERFAALGSLAEPLPESTPTLTQAPALTSAHTCPLCDPEDDLGANDRRVRKVDRRVNGFDRRGCARG